ncbi:hypothetical protein ACHWQZ_G007571 [Mnemiopsis leidyi]
MINTCQVYQQLNETLYSNLVHASVQTETGGLTNTPSSDIEIDQVVQLDSFMLINSVGDIEAPSSLYGKGQQVDQSVHTTRPIPCIDNFYSGAISDISSKDLSTGSDEIIDSQYETYSEAGKDSVTKPVNSTEISSVQPIEMLSECLFNQFSVTTLVNELSFTHKFLNRSALYFGKYPYRYKGGFHEPRDLKPGSYVDKMCSYLEIVLPDLKYNSVLIQLFENGDQSLPSHSDDEACIDDQSDIVTVSLGATRKLVFREANSGRVVHSEQLKHGSISRMSKISQKYYRHEIPKDPQCTEPRVSLTFRLIRKPDVPFAQNQVARSSENLSFPGDTSLCGHVPFPACGPTTKRIEKNPQQAPTVDSVPTTRSVLYISSSMFRYIDTKKLSSSQVSAKKLFYPGANASVMLEKLKRDLPHLGIIPSSIYIMCGTNNVGSIYYGSRSLQGSFNQLTEVLQYLHAKFPDVNINVINILPRATPGKNDVVRELNSLLKNYCGIKGMRFMETKHLFNTVQGKRKNQYFVSPSKQIIDNCHLNEIGVTRLEIAGHHHQTDSACPTRIKLKLQEHFKQLWEVERHKSSKLSYYNQVKRMPHIHYEDFLDLVHSALKTENASCGSDQAATDLTAKQEGSVLSFDPDSDPDAESIRPSEPPLLNQDRLLDLDKTRSKSFVRHAFAEQQINKLTWYQNTIKLLEIAGHHHQTDSACPTRIKLKLQEHFNQLWEVERHKSSKLSYYNQVKRTPHIHYEDFLDLVCTEDRKCLMRLRSNRKVCDRQGACNNALKSWYKRCEFCVSDDTKWLTHLPFCNIIEEDEHHILISCPKFHQLRTELHEETESLLLRNEDHHYLYNQPHIYRFGGYVRKFVKQRFPKTKKKKDTK